MKELHFHVFVLTCLCFCLVLPYVVLSSHGDGHNFLMVPVVFCLLLNPFTFSIPFLYSILVCCCRLSFVFCLLSFVFCLLSFVFVFVALSFVFCLCLCLCLLSLSLSLSCRVFVVSYRILSFSCRLSFFQTDVIGCCIFGRSCIRGRFC